MPARPETLILQWRDFNFYHAILPQRLAGAWCDICLLPPAGQGDAPSELLAATLWFDLLDPDEMALPASPLISNEAGRLLTFIPQAATGMRLALYVVDRGSAAPMPAFVTLSFRSRSRLNTSLRLAGRHAGFLAGNLLRTLWHNPRCLISQLRDDMRQLAGKPQTMPFHVWTRLFDRWREEDQKKLLALPSANPLPNILAIVLHDDPHGAALQATLDSLSKSWLADVPVHAMRRDNVAGLRAALTPGPDFAAVLEAGEVVPPHALGLLSCLAAAAETSEASRLDLLYADEDTLTAAGDRQSPHFKPPPGQAAMLSATPCTGLWLIRQTLLVQALETITGKLSQRTEVWAEAWRLQAWLQLREASMTARARHVPHILTHRRADTVLAPADHLAAIVRSHLVRSGLQATVTATRPVRIRFQADAGRHQRVSIIIPTACKSRHVGKDIASVLRVTDYDDFEVVIVISGKGPLEAGQRHILAPIEADPRVRIVRVEAERFNYAQSNNVAAATCTSPLICLLNDDVSASEPGWLAAMVGHLSDRTVGVVGALLLYPDETVQHAGVVLLPDGTGEHLHRLRSCPKGHLPQDIISQDVSAVTGACLLTRRTVWDRLGGLDEAFPTAFNDVDFCLRVHEIGQRVVIAADARLTHAESTTFGSHYGPNEQARNRFERQRLLARFSDAFRSDPFHSPNKSVRSRDCCSPAFPPRVAQHCKMDPLEDRPFPKNLS